MPFKLRLEALRAHARHHSSSSSLRSRRALEPLRAPWQRGGGGGGGAAGSAGIDDDTGAAEALLWALRGVHSRAVAAAFVRAGGQGPPPRVAEGARAAAAAAASGGGGGWGRGRTHVWASEARAAADHVRMF